MKEEEILDIEIIDEEKPKEEEFEEQRLSQEEDDIIIASEIKEKTEEKRLSKEELLGKTYNLTEELKEIKIEGEKDEINSKKSATFIAFLFIFLLLFVVALPLIVKIFSK